MCAGYTTNILQLLPYSPVRVETRKKAHNSNLRRHFEQAAEWTQKNGEGIKLQESHFCDWEQMMYGVL